MDIEDRAEDLLERLDLLGFAAGLTCEDLYGNGVRDPLCKCCNHLARALSSLQAIASFAADPAKLKTAAQHLQAVSASQRDAASGKLDAALSALAKAIDPTAAAGSSRTEYLELAAAFLQAARMISYKQQQQQGQQQEKDDSDATSAQSIAVEENTAADGTAQVRLLAKLLRVDAERSHALPILQDVVPAVEAYVHQLPAGFFQPMAQLNTLDGGQLDVLREVDGALHKEYQIRRKMLIERIKVTLQSFLWSPRIVEKGTKSEVEALISECQSQLREAPAVTLADVDQVTPAEVASVMRRATSGAGGTFDASVKRVIIGKVPDRGGRTEGRAKEATMPDWAPRRESGGSGGGGGRGGGRGGWKGGGRGGGWLRGGRGRQPPEPPQQQPPPEHYQQQHMQPWGGRGEGRGGRGGPPTQPAQQLQHQQQQVWHVQHEGGRGGWGQQQSHQQWQQQSYQGQSSAEEWGGFGRGGALGPRGSGQGRRGGWGRGGRQ